jgi:hypothetical protein
VEVIELGRPGGDPPRRGSGGRGLAFGVAAVLVLGAVAYGATRPTHPAPKPAPTTPAAIGTPLPSEPPSPVPTTPPPPSRLRAKTGLAIAGPSDGLLYMSLDSDTITGAPVGEDDLQAVEPVAAIPGGWLLGQWPACAGEVCGDATFYAFRGAVARVGQGSTAHPDPDGATVWLTRSVRGNGRALERRTYSGRLVGPATSLRDGEEVIGVTTDGPVVGTYGEAGQLALLDHATRHRRVLVADGYPLAAAGRAVAWLPRDCPPGTGEDCNMHFTDVATRDTAAVGPVTVTESRAAFDPAGRHLAVRVLSDRGQVAVLDADVAHETFGLAATIALPADPVWFGWSPGGSWLVFACQDTDAQGINQGQPIYAWRHGTARAAAAGTFPGAAGERFAVGPAR